ncbi:MAG: adenosylmethionine--8-amino-7-oxononanoate transaminase [Candidatus Baltobacteraceae bacterium]
MPSHLWLPFTQMRNFDASSRNFVGAEGNYLIDGTGRRVFDAVSSIWTTIHGHCHPHITERIAKQAATLDHSTLLGATNPVAEELASRLCALTGLEHAFFSGDGASAVEVALKMAIQYWQNVGQPERTRFVRLASSYHGDTAGAMSVSDIEVFKSRFGAITFEAIPYVQGAESLQALDVAAIIVEPLVQAAAGIRTVAKDCYAPILRERHDNGPLLIVDEIATGFGRTGTMFATEQLGLRPDLMCVGKGLTGGTLPLSATLTNSKIYDVFLGKREEAKHLFHGHSFAGNPIACAAALASLELFEIEDTLTKSRAVGKVLLHELNALNKLDVVNDVRGIGMMHAVEVKRDPWSVANELYERGFFTRPIGNAIQCVPPLSTTAEEASAFARTLAEVLA